MQRIPLTKGHSACIDDINFAAVTAIGKWSFSGGYAVHYYVDDLGRRQRLFMHRFIMQRILGHPIPPGLQVDHISGSILGKVARLDNQRENLRLATRSQNQASKGPQINSTSRFKGVNFRHGKYDVKLRYQGKRIYLGRYQTLEQAHRVYAYAHRLLWGEFTTEAHVPEPAPVLQARILNALAGQGISAM